MKEQTLAHRLLGKKVQVTDEENMYWTYKKGTIECVVKTGKRVSERPQHGYKYDYEYIVQFRHPMEWSNFRLDQLEILK